MANRREFPKAIKVEIIKRATCDGVTYCEECGLPCKRFQIDHTKADGLEIDKSHRLTARDGKLLCSSTKRPKEFCHGRKTAEQDIPAIAEAKRREAAYVGARTRPVAEIRGGLMAKSDRQIERSKREPKQQAQGAPAISRQYQEAT